jgi:hypothetical protein
LSTAISDLQTLLASMSPILDERAVAFVSLSDDSSALAAIPAASVIGTFREREGLTLITDLVAAEQAGLPILFRAGWITLTVHSDLQAVGLTAAFATALGAAGISCNVIAAAYHDHLFVPLEVSARALEVLRTLQQTAAKAAGT